MRKTILAAMAVATLLTGTAAFASTSSADRWLNPQPLPPRSDDAVATVITA